MTISANVKTLTLIADSNIVHLNDYFNETVLGVPVTVMAMAGRDIDAQVIAQHQPDALLIRSVTNVNADLFTSEQSSSGLLTTNSRVKFVGSATIGTDHVDQDYLAENNLDFANAAGCSKHSVAQYVMTAILSLRPHYWQTANTPTLGIIGLGNIGSTLAQYAKDLGWNVLGYDPLLPASDINNASFEQVLSQSHMISLHVPLTNKEQSCEPTWHLIDAKALSLMSKDTMLINTARGPVINEAALLHDLSENKRQVVLDVFEHEPYVPSPLLDQLAIATPHIAGYTLEGKLRGTQMVFEAFVNTFSDVLAVEQSQLMPSLLPQNPYYWQDLKQSPDKLTTFYDIYADDRLLRMAVDSGLKKVSGETFDALRKSYTLRREWLYE